MVNPVQQLKTGCMIILVLIVPVWPVFCNADSDYYRVIIRTADHGSAKAGVTATFYMSIDNIMPHNSRNTLHHG